MTVADVKRSVRQAKLRHAWVLGLVLIGYVAWAQPIALGPMALGMAKVWVGAVMGYWIDKALFDYAKPDDAEPNADWMFRRALIVSACVVGLAL